MVPASDPTCDNRSRDRESHVKRLQVYSFSSTSSTTHTLSSVACLPLANQLTRASATKEMANPGRLHAAHQPVSPLHIRHFWPVRPALVRRLRLNPPTTPRLFLMRRNHLLLFHFCGRGCRIRRISPSRGRSGRARRPARTLAACALGHMPRHDALARKVRAAQSAHKRPQPLMPRRAVAGEVPLVRKPRVAAGAAVRLEALMYGAGVG